MNWPDGEIDFNQSYPERSELISEGALVFMEAGREQPSAFETTKKWEAVGHD
jgi:hypothetical protein